MATVWMDEYDIVGRDAQGNIIPISKFPIATQNKTLSASSQTMTLNSRTRFVAIHANGGCHVKEDADATTSHKHITGDGLERWFDVTDNTDVRVIQE